MKLSICMITYNHEQYISDAIEGVLLQQVDFDYELVISDDVSMDNTLNIINKYKLLHPDKIRVLPNKKNVGMMSNFISTLKSCSGKYIALCEGDDYWTDSLKLQKQVNFLDSKTDFSICFHKVETIKFESGISLGSWPSNSVDESTVEDLARGNYIPTVSCVFRNNIKDTLPTWFSESPIGDYSLHMINAKSGKLKFFPDIMAVYRRHDKGVWSGAALNSTHIDVFKTIHFIKKEFQEKSYSSVLKKLQIQQYSIMGQLLENSDEEFRKFFLTNYSEEIANLITSSWRNIANDYVTLQGRGAQLGIELSKVFRKFLK